MAVGEQNPRLPRDFYHLVRPNTALWIGRILPLMPWVYFPLRYLADSIGLELDMDALSEQGMAASIFAIIVYGFWMAGIMLTPSFKGGFFQYTEAQYMDEFEIRLVEKARLFAFRVMGVGLLASMMMLPTKGPIAELTGGPSVAGLSLAVTGLMLILFTVSSAYFHWRLKPVPPDENIRPDPPFMSDRDVAKGFWRR